MRIDWLEDIVALLDARGVADAAVLRNLTQPAFSRRLRALEDVLGMPLVDRETRPSGPSRVLRDHADRFRRLANDQRVLLSAMRQAQSQGRPQIAIVCQHAITMSLGSAIVSALRDRGGGSVRLRSANRDECETMLYSREAVISVTYRLATEPAKAVPDLLEEAVLGSELLIPVVGTPHANRLMWDFHQGRLTTVGYPADVFLGSVLARHVACTLARRCDIVVAAETALTPAAMQMAQAGIGVAWIPRALAANAIRAGDLVNLAEELGSVNLQLVAHRWKGSPDPQSQAAWQGLFSGLLRAAAT